MPLILLLRVVFSLLSLAILAAVGFLLWEWWEGDGVIDAAGVYSVEREGWMLWTALGLLGWSFLGRLIVLPLITRPGEAANAAHGEGALLASPTGSQLHVETEGAGDGPTVVLVHGWALDSTIWRNVRRHLSPRCRVVSWDLPGLGKSRLGKDKRVTLPRMAEDLRAVVAAHAGDRGVILVGHSIGGMTIQTLARDHPDMFGREVAGVVLLNTSYTNPLRTMIMPRLAQALRWPVLEPAMRLTIWLAPLAWLSAWQSYLSGASHIANRFGFGPDATRGQVEHVTLLMTRDSPAVIAKGNLAMFRWDADGAMAKAPAPLLVIGGAIDIVTKEEAGRHIARTRSDAESLTVPRANHMGFLDCEGAYMTALDAFINRTARRGRDAAAAV